MVPSTIRKIALVIALLILCWQLTRLPHAINVSRGDFPGYWAAGRLSLLGQDPYSPEALLALEQEAGWPAAEPYMPFRYPPWTLMLMMPSGLLPYAIGRLLWLLLSFAGVASCSVWLWRYYGGPAGKGWLALALACTFAPFVLLLVEGQIGGFMLVGLVGFLYFANRRRWLLAGLCTFPVTAKPHLLYAFWIVLFLWALREKRWRVLAGVLLGCLAASTVVLLLNPRIFDLFLDEMDRSLADYPPQTLALGSVLRALFSSERPGLQSLPLVAGSLWAVFYWRRWRHAWDWGERLPVLLLASFVASASAWMHDLVVLLIAIESVMAALVSGRRSSPARASTAPLVVGQFARWPNIFQRWRVSRVRPALPVTGVLLAIDVLALACLPVFRFNSLWYAWMPPAFLAWYLWAGGHRRTATDRRA